MSPSVPKPPKSEPKPKRRPRAKNVKRAKANEARALTMRKP